MNPDNDFLEYDDDAAIAFIQNHLPLDLKEKFSDDTIVYLLDTICDFYDKKDFLEDEDEEKEEKELIAFLVSQAKEDEIATFSNDEMQLFLKAEEAYSNTLDIIE